MEIYEKVKKPAKNYFHASLCQLKQQEPTSLHYHDVLEIGLCLSGRGECLTSDGRTHFEAGYTQLFPPFVPHYSIASTDDTVWAFVNIDIHRIYSKHMTPDPAFLIDVIKGIRISGIFNEKEYPLINKLLTDIVNMMRMEISENGEALDLITVKLCELLLELSMSEQKNTIIVENARRTEIILPAIRLVTRRLDKHSPVSVTDMANKCFMSESHFRKLFSSIMGETPKAYILRMQMQKATGLLLSTTQPIAQIAQSCGFEDNSTFYRCFVRNYGISPTDYRSKG